MAHRRGVVKFLATVTLCHAGLFVMRSLDFDSEGSDFLHLEYIQIVAWFRKFYVNHCDGVAIGAASHSRDFDDFESFGAKVVGDEVFRETSRDAPNYGLFVFVRLESEREEFDFVIGEETVRKTEMMFALDG